MASFLWKGVKLEPWLVSSFYACLPMGLMEITQDPLYSIQCVCFSLGKCLCNHYHPGGVSYVMGVLVANRYASWVELVWIHGSPLPTGFVTNGYLFRYVAICMRYSDISGGTCAHPQNGHPYAGGLSVEEQYQAAIRASLRGETTQAWVVFIKQ
uniref:Uncharacterized protein n=1 Tax=Hucho hucho TaxID=62062 RepID=A0A4W5NNL9_9TELE